MPPAPYLSAAGTGRGAAPALFGWAPAESNLTAAAGKIRRQFGRPLPVIVWSVADFASRYQHRDRLREIIETGWVISGESLSEVTRVSGTERHPNWRPRDVTAPPLAPLRALRGYAGGASRRKRHLQYMSSG